MPYFDFNITIQDLDDEKKQLQEITKFVHQAIELGYDGIVINRVINNRKLTETDRVKKFPIQTENIISNGFHLFESDDNNDNNNNNNNFVESSSSSSSKLLLLL